ncbi:MULTISPECIES: hypothetical protein [Polymorphospora]|uniref:Secreted protein n=1 Tax=Polymorphospora lycopeni TaxID=3140240 RepID=A0ABV5CUN6_9ACTN
MSNGLVVVAVLTLAVLMAAGLAPAAATARVAVTSNTAPVAPVDLLSHGQVCGTGTARPTLATLRPVLAGTQSDPDVGQQELTTWFYWWLASGSRNETDKLAQASGNPSIVSAQIPVGRLTDGQIYVWQARTHDGSAYGSWSVTCEFRVQLTSVR